MRDLGDRDKLPDDKGDKLPHCDKEKGKKHEDEPCKAVSAVKIIVPAAHVMLPFNRVSRDRDRDIR